MPRIHLLSAIISRRSGIRNETGGPASRSRVRGRRATHPLDTSGLITMRSPRGSSRCADAVATSGPAYGYSCRPFGHMLSIAAKFGQRRWWRARRHLLVAADLPNHPPRLAGIALNAWASGLGFLIGEIFGSLPELIPDTDRL